MKNITTLLLSLFLTISYAQNKDFVNNLIKSVECNTTCLYRVEDNTTIVLDEINRQRNNSKIDEFYNLKVESNLLVDFYNMLDRENVFEDIYESKRIKTGERYTRSFVNLDNGEIVNTEKVALVITTMFDIECSGKQYYYLIFDKQKALDILENTSNITNQSKKINILINNIKM